jgi:uncharacterized protein Smg (DUF494 family)
VSRPADRDPVRRLLALVARHLEAYLDGDELALETLPDAIDQAGVGPEDIASAVLALQAFVGEGGGSADVAATPGPTTERVPSAEERDSLSPEAWGCLLDLRRNGMLDAVQFEQVLERLTATGVRPVGPELALEVASHVALLENREPCSPAFGDGEITH